MMELFSSDEEIGVPRNVLRSRSRLPTLFFRPPPPRRFPSPCLRMVRSSESSHGPAGLVIQYCARHCQRKQPVSFHFFAAVCHALLSMASLALISDGLRPLLSMLTTSPPSAPSASSEIHSLSHQLRCPNTRLVATCQVDVGLLLPGHLPFD